MACGRRSGWELWSVAVLVVLLISATGVALLHSHKDWADQGCQLCHVRNLPSLHSPIAIGPARPINTERNWQAERPAAERERRLDAALPQLEVGDVVSVAEVEPQMRLLRVLRRHHHARLASIEMHHGDAALEEVQQRLAFVRHPPHDGPRVTAIPRRIADTGSRLSPGCAWGVAWAVEGAGAGGAC